MAEHTESQVDEVVNGDGATADDGLPEQEPGSDRLYTPAPGEPQLTVKAVVIGCVLGSAISGMNLYLGLRIGWSIGGSLMAAILSFAFFTALGKKFSVLETNIAQTTGSGAGSMASAAGMLAPIPALFLLGEELTWWELYLWSLAIAYLGVNFAVPLRRQYVVIEKLRFPTGTATAETIVAMFAKAGDALEKARVLLYFAAGAAAFTLLLHFWPLIAQGAGFENYTSLDLPPLHAWITGGVIAAAAAWGFQLFLGPMMFGVGMLIGPRVGLSLLFGAIVGWGLLGPWSQSAGWAPEAVMSYQSGGVWGPRGWILWPGVAIMVAEALTALALSWRTFVAAFRMPTQSNLPEAAASVPSSETIPNRWWMTTLAIGASMTILIAQFAFGIPFYFTIIAIVLSAVLANVAVRSTGETDINPLGGMGKVTQLVFGGLSSDMVANLQGANITSAGASQAGDMMQDLKTGYLLGASPRKQYIAQLIGIGSGIIFTVPLFFVFKDTYELGSAAMPAPAAMAWKAMAEVLSKGVDSLPPMAVNAAIGGLVVGTMLPLLRKTSPTVAKFTPNGLAMGMAMLVPAFYSVTLAAGSIALVIWSKANKPQCERLVYAVAAGLIAGEGLMGIVNALLAFFGIGTA